MQRSPPRCTILLSLHIGCTLAIWRRGTVVFFLSYADENGEELKTVACRIDDGNDATRSAGSSFYIRFRTETVTLILAIAAATVWSVAVIRFLRIRKQKRTGE